VVKKLVMTLIAMSLLAALLVPALTVAADTPDPTFGFVMDADPGTAGNQDYLIVDSGDPVVINVMIGTDIPSSGGSTRVDLTPDGGMTSVSVAGGTAFAMYMGTGAGKGEDDLISGFNLAGTFGPGVGLFATYNFDTTGVADGTIIDLDFSEASIKDASGTTINAIGGSTGCTIQVGQLQGPDLTVIAKEEVATATPGQYTVNYTIKNIGNQPAGATTTGIYKSTDGGTTWVLVADDACPALNPDQTHDGVSAAIALNDGDMVKVVADNASYPGVVAETNENNNEMINTFLSIFDDGTIWVHKNILGTITIVIITPDVNGDLSVGDNCMGESEDAQFTVYTNGKYTVNASDIDDGHMDEYDVTGPTPVLVPGGRSLINPLHVYQTDACPVSGTPMGGALTSTQTLVVDNDCAGQEGGMGETYGVRFTQEIELGDDVLPAGKQYATTVTFTAIYTGACD